MLPIVVRTSEEGLGFLVSEWLPAGRLHLRTDQDVAVGDAQDTRLVLPDGREVMLTGEVEAVERDERGIRVTVRLIEGNEAALAVLRKAAEPPPAPETDLDLPRPREPLPSVEVLLHGRQSEIPELEPVHPTPAPLDDGLRARRASPVGLTSAPPEELLVMPQSSFVALAPPMPPPPPPRPVTRTSPPLPPPPPPRVAPPRPGMSPPPISHLTPPPEVPPSRTATPAPPPVPAAAIARASPTAPPPPPTPRGAKGRATHSGLIEQARLAADELADAFAKIAAMGLADDRRRAAILRRAVDVLRPVEAPELLADLLLRVLPVLPASTHEERASLERALLELLPAPALLRAATSLARQAPLLASVGGAEAARRLETAVRVVTLALVTRAKKLDADGQALLVAMSESGGALARKMPPELSSSWIAGARYLRASRREAEVAFAALDAAASQDEYQAELYAFEPAVDLLRRERRWEPLAPLIGLVARHRDLPRGPFPERSFLASSVLDRFFAGHAVADLSRAFSESAGEARADLLKILAAAGEPAALQLVEILKRSSDVALRRDAIGLLKTQSEATRRALLRLLDAPEVEWVVIQNLLPLLGEVGRDSDMPLISAWREHPHMQVRRAVLEGLAALGGRRAEPVLLRGLDDKSRIVQVRALTLLGQVKSTDPHTLRYVFDLLRDTQAPDEDEDLLMAGIEALALIGNVPLPDGAGNAEELLIKTLEGTRRGALAKLVRGTSGSVWQKPPVRKVLCSALGRIGGDKAEAALKKLAYDAADAVQRDAEQALFAIAARKKAQGK